MDNILYAIAGGAAYAVLRRIYQAFDPDGRRREAVAGQIAALQVENSRLRAALASSGVEVDDPPYVSRVRDLVAQGKKINAIKEFREATGVDLRTAKAFVEGLPFSPAVSSTVVTDDSHDRVKNLVIAGNKIAAIRDYRQATGADLRTAKEYVETLARELGR